MNFPSLVYIRKIYFLKSFFSFDKIYFVSFVKTIERSIFKIIKVYFKYTLTCLTYNHVLGFKISLKYTFSVTKIAQVYFKYS